MHESTVIGRLIELAEAVSNRLPNSYFPKIDVGYPVHIYSDNLSLYTRYNPERHCWWFGVHCSTKNFE